MSLNLGHLLKLFQATTDLEDKVIPLTGHSYKNVHANPLTLRSKFEFSFVSPIFISYRSSGEKLIKYQANLSCVIMPVILMVTLFYKALILHGEI